MKFEHTITLLVRTEEDNPDMPSLNVNTMAEAMAVWAESQLVSTHPKRAILYCDVSVTEARRIK